MNDQADVPQIDTSPKGTVEREGLKDSDSEFLNELDSTLTNSSDLAEEVSGAQQDLIPKVTDSIAAESDISDAGDSSPEANTDEIAANSDVLQQQQPKETAAKLAATNSTPNNSAEYWKEIPRWLVVSVSLAIGGIGLWQANEWADWTFRLDTTNRALDAKLNEALTRIDLLKETLISVKRQLQLLQQQQQQHPKLTAPPPQHSALPNTRTTPPQL